MSGKLNNYILLFATMYYSCYWFEWNLYEYYDAGMTRDPGVNPKYKSYVAAAINQGR